MRECWIEDVEPTLEREVIIVKLFLLSTTDRRVGRASKSACNDFGSSDLFLWWWYDLLSSSVYALMFLACLMQGFWNGFEPCKNPAKVLSLWAFYWWLGQKGGENECHEPWLLICSRVTKMHPLCFYCRVPSFRAMRTMIHSELWSFWKDLKRERFTYASFLVQSDERVLRWVKLEVKWADEEPANIQCLDCPDLSFWSWCTRAEILSKMISVPLTTEASSISNDYLKEWIYSEAFKMYLTKRDKLFTAFY